MSRVVIIIQARMSSTRLPGKVLLQVRGRSLLAYLLERMNRVKNADQVVVATTDDPSDDAIVTVCRSLGIPVYRGSQEDVLKRYLEAAKEYQADIIVRVTADCPLLDPEIVDHVIDEFLEQNVDYASNTLERTWPRGMDVEVFSMNALTKAAELAHSPAEREHVTLGIYSRPEEFRLFNLSSDQNDSHFRWTVDTIEDFNLISKMLEAIYPEQPHFDYASLLELMKHHPEWAKINSDVRQKS